MSNYKIGWDSPNAINIVEGGIVPGLPYLGRPLYFRSTTQVTEEKVDFKCNPSVVTPRSGFGTGNNVIVPQGTVCLYGSGSDWFHPVADGFGESFTLEEVEIGSEFSINVTGLVSHDLPASAGEGENVSGLITANEGYLLTSVNVLGENILGEAAPSSAVAFQMPGENVSIVCETIAACQFSEEMRVVYIDEFYGVPKTVDCGIGDLIGDGLVIPGNLIFQGGCVIVRARDGKPIKTGKYELMAKSLSIPEILDWVVQSSFNVTSAMRGIKLPIGSYYSDLKVRFTSDGATEPSDCNENSEIYDVEGEEYLPETTILEAYAPIGTSTTIPPDSTGEPYYPGVEPGGIPLGQEYPVPPIFSGGCSDACMLDQNNQLKFIGEQIAIGRVDLTKNLQDINENVGLLLKKIQEIKEENLDKIKESMVSSISEKGLADLVEEIEPVWIENEVDVSSRVDRFPSSRTKF